MVDAVLDEYHHMSYLKKCLKSRRLQTTGINAGQPMHRSGEQQQASDRVIGHGPGMGAARTGPLIRKADLRYLAQVVPASIKATLTIESLIHKIDNTFESSIFDNDEDAAGGLLSVKV